MQGVGSNFSPIDFFLDSTSAGVQLISRALSPSGNYSKVNRLLIGLMGLGYLCTGTVTAAMAFPASSPADCKDGDLWNGYCYPYEEFPHGHYDAAHGSIVFEYYRCQDNEQYRQRLFRDTEICIRGRGDISVYEEDVHGKRDLKLVCFENGTKSYTGMMGVIEKLRDIL